MLQRHALQQTCQRGQGRPNDPKPQPQWPGPPFPHEPARSSGCPPAGDGLLVHLPLLHRLQVDVCLLLLLLGGFELPDTLEWNVLHCLQTP